MQDRSIRERSKAFVGDNLNDDEDLIDFFDANLAEFGNKKNSNSIRKRGTILGSDNEYLLTGKQKQKFNA